MANTENLQDLILNEVRREHTAVTMFLMNGFQLKGYHQKGFRVFFQMFFQPFHSVVGTVIFQKVFHPFAPSIFAAS